MILISFTGIERGAVDGEATHGRVDDARTLHWLEHVADLNEHTSRVGASVQIGERDVDTERAVHEGRLLARQSAGGRDAELAVRVHREELAELRVADGVRDAIGCRIEAGVRRRHAYTKRRRRLSAVRVTRRQQVVLATREREAELLFEQALKTNSHRCRAHVSPPFLVTFSFILTNSFHFNSNRVNPTYYRNSSLYLTLNWSHTKIPH